MYTLTLFTLTIDNRHHGFGCRLKIIQSAMAGCARGPPLPPFDTRFPPNVAARLSTGSRLFTPRFLNLAPPHETGKQPSNRQMRCSSREV